MVRFIALAWALVVLAAPAVVAADPGRRAVVRPRSQARQLWRRMGKPGRDKIRPGQLTHLKGALYNARPGLIEKTRPVPATGKRKEHQDPSFSATHPMFRRLVRQGWFERTPRIERLQRLAERVGHKPPELSTPLGEVEFLAFDLEASGGDAGREHGGLKRFLSGWAEVTQFGYTVYRGGRAVESGRIDIRPDVAIDPRVQELTGLNHAKLAKAPHFEKVAEQLLTVMAGRVLIGQSAAKKDWSWLTSNLARIGVDLPNRRDAIMDTFKLSLHHSAGGLGLSAMCQQFGVPLPKAHDAAHDAKATGAVFFEMARRGGAKTLGDAYALMVKPAKGASR